MHCMNIHDYVVPLKDLDFQNDPLAEPGTSSLIVTLKYNPALISIYIPSFL